MRADTELHAGKRTTSRRTLHNFGGTPAPEGHYAHLLLQFSFFPTFASLLRRKGKGEREKSKANGLVALSIGQRPMNRGER